MEDNKDYWDFRGYISNPEGSDELKEHKRILSNAKLEDFPLKFQLAVKFMPAAATLENSRTYDVVAETALKLAKALIHEYAKEELEIIWLKREKNTKAKEKES